MKRDSDFSPGSVVAGNYAIAAAVCVALVLRFCRLDHAAFWFDETFTARWIELPWTEMIRGSLLGRDANHLPTYFVLLKGWSLAFGTSPWALRSLGVVLSGAMVYLVFRLAEVTAGKRAAIWSAGVAALSPYLIHHAQEARMYSLVAFLAAGSSLALARYVTDRGRVLSYSFVLWSWALLLTHYYGLIYVVGLLLALVVSRRRDWREWLPQFSLVTFGMLGVTYLAVFVAGRQSGVLYDIDWLAPPGVVWSMMSGYTLLPTSEALHAMGARATLPYLPIAVLAVPGLLWVVITGARRIQSEARPLIYIALTAALAGPFAVSLVFSDVSLHPRYFAAGAAVAIVLIGAGAPKRTAWRKASTLAFFVTVAVMAVGTTLHLVEPGHGRVDIYGAGRWLDENVPEDDEILVTSQEMGRLARFHWPERRFILYPPAGTVANRKNARQLSRAMPAFLQSRVCYVFGRAWDSDPKGALQEAVAEEYGVLSDVRLRGIRILCFSSEPSLSERGF